VDAVSFVATALLQVFNTGRGRNRDKLCRYFYVEKN